MELAQSLRREPHPGRVFDRDFAHLDQAGTAPAVGDQPNCIQADPGLVFGASPRVATEQVLQLIEAHRILLPGPEQRLDISVIDLDIPFA